MIIPGALSTPSTEREDLSADTMREITNVSVIPFPIVEIVEESVVVFTVPDREYYRIAALSYYARSSGNIVFYLRRSGESSLSSNIIATYALTNQEEAKVEAIEAHVLGPGESLAVQATGSAATVNVKLSVERITGTI